MTTPRDRLSAIRHGDLPFHNPLDPAIVDEVLDVAGLGPGDRAVDLGCGPGELLVRLSQRTGCGGLGVDLAAAQIEEARRRAAARAPDAALQFEAMDAGEVEGDFALASCVGSTHALGGLDQALQRLAELTRPDGHVLVGEGFWDRYEWQLIANAERFLAAYPGAPEADELRECNDASRDRVLGSGGRGTLGFALVLLRRADR